MLFLQRAHPDSSRHPRDIHAKQARPPDPNGSLVSREKVDVAFDRLLNGADSDIASERASERCTTRPERGTLATLSAMFAGS